jgi:hypothetical protein
MLLHPISLLSNWPLPMPSKPTTNLYLSHLLLLNGRLQLGYDQHAQQATFLPFLFVQHFFVAQM